MGRATAHLFADEGARVAVNDVSQEGVEKVVAEIHGAHGPEAAIAVPGDIAAGGGAERLVEAVIGAFGGLDVLINNAGVALPDSAFMPLDEFDANWQRSMDVNVTAQARLIHLLREHLAESGEGRVVNIASTEALVTTAGMAGYAASKAAVVGLTKSFAVELGRHGITVNCICPGPIVTGMTASISDEDKQTYARRRVPLRRYGDPEEVAQMTLSFCLPAASYLNGAIVPVDGGMSIRHT
jgi:3-oxoacyl-[acyl-carrier protein] reductase